MVDDGETVSATLRREFQEEAGNLTDPDQQKRFQELMDVSSLSNEIYAMVGDSRSQRLFPKLCVCTCSVVFLHNWFAAAAL
jgi:8-oxo-dGTP pyrophosphatase MutT (NUDIX family)